MKQGQVSNITIIFWVFVFITLWSLFFAGQISTWGHTAVVNGGLTGIEALLYDNLNLVIAVVLLIFIVAVGFGGGQG